MKINCFNSEIYFFTDSISENLTDLDLESSIFQTFRNIFCKIKNFILHEILQEFDHVIWLIHGLNSTQLKGLFYFDTFEKSIFFTLFEFVIFSLKKTLTAFFSKQSFLIRWKWFLRNHWTNPYEILTKYSTNKYLSYIVYPC